MAGRGARSSRPAPGRARSRHFLRSSRLAHELVHDAEIARSKLVLEIGAGFGRLTAELRRAARQVLAVELDPELAAGLRRRFAGTNVVVVERDALELPLPREPFRVLANLPFHATAGILRHLLDDPAAPLTRADLIVEWGVARKRSETWPSTLLGVTWGAWFTFELTRRLPAGCFAPRPSVDAGLLSIARRLQPLLSVQEAKQYERFVRSGFARPRLRDGLRPHLPDRQLKRLGDLYGFERDAAARDLDLHQWIALYRASGIASSACDE